MTFFTELKRRNVFRVGAAYAVTAWVLLQVLDVVGEILELPPWGGKLILAILVAGFFVALIVAWAYELTPEGIKREKDVDRDVSITRQTGRKLDRVIIVVLVIAVAYLLVDKLVLQERLAPGEAGDTQTAVAGSEPSVAVLPFANMSRDPDNEYFSDGLTETLLHVLSQLPGLKVAARTSSFAFKGQNLDIGEIAAALGVAHVLEGSVQRADGKVRITAQLIRADDGFHLWSQNYTRPLEDIFAIQDEIAADVAEALGGSLLGAGAPERHVVDTTDLNAYDSYLKGLEQQALYSYTSLDLAENHFKQALARDPGFIDARLALARNYILQFNTGLIDEEDLLALASPLIGQAREQEPGNVQARAYELGLRMATSGPEDSFEDIRGWLDGLEAALQQVPGETFMRVAVASSLSNLFNENQRALELLQAGLLVDPMEGELHRWMARIYKRLGRLDEARASALRATEVAPDNPNTHGTMAEMEAASGNLTASFEWARRATEVDPQDHEIAANIARALYQLRLAEEADYWRARVQALAPGSSLARLLDVERALSRDEVDQVIALSAAMIADQVDMRQGAFDRALVLYTDAMQRASRAREGYDFLLSVRPELADFSAMPPDPQGVFMQWSLVDLMSGFASFEERKAAWVQYDAALRRQGFPGLYDPSDIYHAYDHLMRGDVEQAVAHYLQYEMQVPLAEWIDRYRKELPLSMGPIYADPRVAAALAEEAERFEQAREDVIAMLEGPDWQL